METDFKYIIYSSDVRFNESTSLLRSRGLPLLIFLMTTIISLATQLTQIQILDLTSNELSSTILLLSPLEEAGIPEIEIPEHTVLLFQSG